MTFASVTQSHAYLPWSQHQLIVYSTKLEPAACTDLCSGRRSGSMLPVARSQETVRAAAPAHAESASSSRHTRAVASRLRCWCRPAGYHATLARVGRTLVFQIYTVIEKDAKCVYTSYPAVLGVVRTHRSMLTVQGSGPY